MGHLHGFPSIAFPIQQTIPLNAIPGVLLQGIEGRIELGVRERGCAMSSGKQHLESVAMGADTWSPRLDSPGARSQFPQVKPHHLPGSLQLL